MKYCKDCIHYRSRWSDMRMGKTESCAFYTVVGHDHMGPKKEFLVPEEANENNDCKHHKMELSDIVNQWLEKKWAELKGLIK